MDRIEELITFRAVIDAGSFSGAADKLDMAASVVSRRISNLEHRLGAQLLNRTTRRMSVTDAGQRFYVRAGAVLNALEEAENEAADNRKSLQGLLRIAAPVTFGVKHLSPIISDFMHTHPDILIDLDLSDRRVDLVDEGFDLAVRIGKLKDSSHKARKLSDIKQVVCASPDFWAANGRPDHPDDLKSLPALTYTNTPTARDWPYIGPDGNSGYVRVNPRVSADNGDIIKDLGIAGHGVLCEPCFILHDAIESGQLVPALQTYTWYDMSLYLLWPEQAFVPARTRAFIDFTADRLGSNPYWQHCLR